MSQHFLVNNMVFEHNLSNEDLVEKLRVMNAFIIAKASIPKTRTKKGVREKIDDIQLINRRWNRGQISQQRNSERSLFQAIEKTT